VIKFSALFASLSYIFFLNKCFVSGSVLSITNYRAKRLSTKPYSKVHYKYFLIADGCKQFCYNGERILQFALSLTDSPFNYEIILENFEFLHVHDRQPSLHLRIVQWKWGLIRRQKRCVGLEYPSQRSLCFETLDTFFSSAIYSWFSVAYCIFWMMDLAVYDNFTRESVLYFMSIVPIFWKMVRFLYFFCCFFWFLKKCKLLPYRIFYSNIWLVLFAGTRLQFFWEYEIKIKIFVSDSEQKSNLLFFSVEH